jgi:hypothetical protein
MGCDECHTTLSEGPNGHRDIEPHMWGPSYWQIDSKTGEKWQEHQCYHCHHAKERMSEEYAKLEAEAIEKFGGYSFDKVLPYIRERLSPQATGEKQDL